jgi:hypothetical protein
VLRHTRSVIHKKQLRAQQTECSPNEDFVTFCSVILSDKKRNGDVRPEVFSAVHTVIFFWVFALYRHVDTCQKCRETYRLHLQGYETTLRQIKDRKYLDNKVLRIINEVRAKK